MKKIIVTLLPLVVISGCFHKPGPVVPPYEDGEAKTLKGAGTIFNEVLGYNTKDASIIQLGEERYVVYASNETEQGAQVFAARKGTLVEGKWVYGEKHIVLKGQEDTEKWDYNIYNPSVMKGTFSYQNTQYQYLIAYNGNNNNNGVNNHIGLAVTNDLLGQYVRVGENPIIANPEIYEASYGYGCPSLVSYNQAGQGYLFFAVGDTDVSYTAVKTFDFTNLDQMVLESGYSALPISGISDKVQGEAIITNASFALSSDGNKIMMVRDRLPGSANRPGQTTELEVSKANLAILQDISESWENVEFITGMKTIDMEDEESLGWDQIYSGDFVTDGYGKLLNAQKAEVLYSTYDEDSNAALYSSTLAMYEVTL